MQANPLLPSYLLFPFFVSFLQFVAEVYYAKFCVRKLSSKSRSKPGFVPDCYPVSLSTKVECEPASNSKVPCEPLARRALGVEGMSDSVREHQ